MAPFETSMCKLWNGKHECMDFYNKPMFQSDSVVANADNLRWGPGDILPKGLTAVTFPQPPFSFDTEMQNTRAIAEYRLGIPDLGAQQHLVGTPRGGEKPTATQINAIVGQSGMSTDIRARVFKLAMGVGYQMGWSILLQYDRSNLDYINDGIVMRVDEQAMHAEYLIFPSGSGDSWNRAAQLQKGMARFTMYKGDPYIAQGPLRKNVLELDDPRLVKQLYLEPEQEQADSMEEQAVEISVMLLGFPASVEPADNDFAHLMSMEGFIKQRFATGEAFTPAQARMLLQHAQEHTAQMDAKKDPRSAQLAAQLAPLAYELIKIASADQVPQGAVPPQTSQPSNVTPMPTPQPQTVSGAAISAISPAQTTGIAPQNIPSNIPA
jgi:hypothetical protein